MLELRLFVILLVICSTINAQNYCDPKLCSKKVKHVACNNTGEVSKRCTAPYKLVDMQPYIDLILHEHNTLRNLIAGGGAPPFPTAIRMATMSWDKELEQLATFTVKSCRFAHDCHNSFTYKFSGQSIVLHKTRKTNITQFLKVSIQSLFREKARAKPIDLRVYARKRGIGHFSLMVNERNNRVGCAYMQFRGKGKFNNHYLVCNYGVNNMVGCPVYRFGPKTSKCVTLSNPKYTNLCSESESYIHNNWKKCLKDL